MVGGNNMLVIYAEKEDMGKKIAAALDGITISSGKKVFLNDLHKYEKDVSVLSKRDGYFKINFKGEETYVTWGFGHLCALKNAADYDPAYKNWNALPCPFIPTSYQLKVNGEEKFYGRNVKQLKIIKRLFDKADWIVNSTDDDREGELIFAYVYEFLRCTTEYKRAVFSEQNEKGIREAFDNLQDSSERTNIENAGRARNIADSLVGWNLTAQFTLHNKCSTLSVGRVQTAALNILAIREKAIKSFVPQDYYTVEAEFTTNKGEKYKGLHQSKRFDKKEDAENVLSSISGKSGTITYLTVEDNKVEVPQLYNQAVLQMECNDKFGYSAKETLSITQYLYEKGFTTYPRTSSRYLTENMKDKVDYILDQLQTLPQYKDLIAGKARPFFTKRFFDNSKVTSHFAIIPTGELPSGLETKYQNVYDLICKSVIRMIYSSAKVQNTKVVTTVNGNNFLSVGKTIIQPEWMLVSGIPKTNVLPLLNKGDVVTGEYSMEAKKTKPPHRYTDKTFLQAMLTAGKEISDKELREILSDPQEGGIGTSATRSEIIETLIKRGYAERKGKQFYVSDKGMELIEKFPVDDLKSAEITAKWEKRLADISEGKDNINDFVNDIISSVTKWCDVIKSSPVMTTTSSSKSATSINCPLCGHPLNQYKTGYGCSDYKNGCKFFVGKICGKKLTESQVKKLAENKKTGLIKGFKSKKGTAFNAYLILDSAGKINFEFEKRSS